MPDQLQRQLIAFTAFLNEGVRPNARRLLFRNWIARRFGFFGKVDEVYRALAFSEMLAWAELGEIIGYFPGGSSQLTTIPRLTEVVQQSIRSSPLYRREGDNVWSSVMDITIHRYGKLFATLQALQPESSRNSIWFRTQLLLAERFGRARPVKFFLGTMVTESDDEWSQLIADLMHQIETGSLNALRSIDRALLEGSTNHDRDIGAGSRNSAVLLAGFLLVLDQMAVGNRQRQPPQVQNELSDAAAIIRRCRLNFSSPSIRERFLEMARAAERADEYSARNFLRRRLEKARIAIEQTATIKGVGSFEEGVRGAMAAWLGLDQTGGVERGSVLEHV